MTEVVKVLKRLGNDQQRIKFINSRAGERSGIIYLKMQRSDFLPDPL